MDTKELCGKLRIAGLGWSPISDPEIPAVMVRVWDAASPKPDVPEPVRGSYYVYWPDNPLTPDMLW